MPSIGAVEAPGRGGLIVAESSGSQRLRGRTLWTQGVAAPVRTFLRTESGSAGVLVATIVAALVWSNVDAASYEGFWHTGFSIRLGSVGVERDLRTWVDSGLMTFFFLVVGLEARREFDLGDLRERRRFLLPFASGIAGMLVPVLIYLAVNHAGPGTHGWGAAMSSDTALALGLLALLGRGVPDRVRVFLLTVFVVDDLLSLVVIAVVYSDRIEAAPLGVAVGVFALLLGAMAAGLDRPALYVLLGVALWAALLASGVDPVVAGIAI